MITGILILTSTIVFTLFILILAFPWLWTFFFYKSLDLHKHVESEQKNKEKCFFNLSYYLSSKIFFFLADTYTFVQISTNIPCLLGAVNCHRFLFWIKSY